jgi:hypothetical protein
MRTPRAAVFHVWRNEWDRSTADPIRPATIPTEPYLAGTWERPCGHALTIPTSRNFAKHVHVVLPVKIQSGQVFRNAEGGHRQDGEAAERQGDGSGDCLCQPLGCPRWSALSGDETFSRSAYRGRIATAADCVVRVVEGRRCPAWRCGDRSSASDLLKPHIIDEDRDIVVGEVLARRGA